ncbi:MAG: ABC transporter, permease protein 2 (cluster 5, nickel/peptides/opines) [uncultured Acidimicrobiales bacterium]|uniref:ABC transporter, permease protein 2 (Cluster 5, nickel/peptides/opines) n=1 Tax=uncultured Acidimicrobiales bacterium TaxID=310071 RepID=A0A6J4IS77_9ACTN|nr:MAG: ABC transporter, permease protein 2 (cluster 5, nickel/peptides/opines) [uncultured Acidimicrobiales bacterium]
MTMGVEPDRPTPPPAEAASPLGAFPAPAAGAQWRLVARRFRRRTLAMAGLAALAVLALSAVFAPLLSPYEVSPTLNSDVLSQSRQSPSLRHPFGTDELGRDQLTRVLHGGRISLLIGLSVAMASSLIGTTVGAIAGYFGGWVDQVLMRLVDLLLVLPGTALLMIAQRGLGGSLPVIILILGFLFWRTVARIVRGVFLSLKQQEFVEAARASGASSARIIVSEMLPSAVGPICVHLTLASGAAILAESALSFLGFGIQPPAVSWGNMLAQSRGAVGTELAYLVYAPGVAILITVLAVNFVGNGLRDALDPHTRA